jgi:ABC-type transport system involved in cytochrome c biogenesis permease subunit
MSNMITSTAITAKGTRNPPREPSLPRPKRGPFRLALEFLASLKITVVLFVLSLVLVFLGTLAQKGLGNWTVVDKYFRNPGFVMIPVQVFGPLAETFLFMAPKTKLPGAFPFPGGWLLGGCLLVNLLAAHAIRFKLSWKRSGVLLLHAGLILLMFSELITGLFAVEGHMQIVEGASANFVEDHRRIELAVVDTSNPKTDDVVVIPGTMLRREERVRHKALPFDVQLDRYMVNSAVTKGVPPDAMNLATDGLGKEGVAVEKPEVSGTSASEESDMASAYVTFYFHGSAQKLGTYLVSQWLNPQPIRVGEKSYQISLRAKRLYKPYTIHVLKLTHKKYIGTDKPKDYRSQIRITDPSRGEDREVAISMNDPFRYQGETFYQSGFRDAAPEMGLMRPITTLQVVRNPGWLIPYIACSMVALGLLVHFSLNLVNFLSLVRKKMLPLTPSIHPSDFGYFFPYLVALGGAVFLVIMMLPPSQPDDQMHLYEFGKLPVVMDGRVKPMDTVARNALMSLSHRQVFKDEDGTYQPAIKWLLDVMISGQRFGRLSNKEETPGQKHQVFRIHNEGILNLLQLKRKPGFYRYSIDEFKGKFDVLESEAKRVREIPEDDRDDFDVKILHLYKQVQLYVELSEFLEPRTLPSPEDPEAWETFPTGLSAMAQAVLTPQAKDAASRALGDMLKTYLHGDSKAFFKKLKAYRELPDEKLTAEEKNRKVRNDLAIGQFALLAAYADGKPKVFNQQLNAYRELLDQNLPPGTTQRASFEVFFNNFSPLDLCSFMYLLVVLLGCLSWLVWFEPLRRAAVWLALVVLAVHVWALFARMYILERPFVFVTNLYSSAIFIGCACVIIGLLVERVFRNGLLIVVGALLGFLTLRLAPILGGEKDTLEMMQAVLDTNFWLATHVTTVALGYTATYLAGAVGIVYLLLGVCTPLLTKDLAKKLSQAIYGILCFATLTSFTGTVLGGIWADQSWGRFWGWDPKENGALLVVLWNALILHARWGGMVKQQGIAVLTIIGNIIVTWSWFGTNQLGVGLHAYGFDKTLVTVTQLTWLAMVVFLIVGSMPQHLWWSNRAEKYAPAPVKPKPQ